MVLTKTFKDCLKFKVEVEAGDLDTTAVANIDLPSAVVGGDATGLVTDTNAVALIDLPSAVVGGDSTGFVTDVAAVGVIELGSAVAGGDATGLANDGTEYKMDVDFSAVVNNVNVTGSSAQTYTDLLTEINADLTDMTATLSVDGTQILITADATGVNTIAITDGTGEALVSTLGATIGTSTVGTASLDYKMTVVMGATTDSVSVAGSSAQTYTTLLAEINTDLTDITATLSGDGTQIVLTADATGVNTIAITDGTSEGMIDTLGATIGTSTSGTASLDYKMNVNLSGVDNAVEVAGSSAQTYTNLLTQINADLTDVTATLSVDGTKIVLTADNEGANTITITDGTSEAMIDSLGATIGTSTAGTEGTVLIPIDNDPTNSRYTKSFYGYQVFTASTNIEKTGLVSSYNTTTGILTISDNGSSSELADGDVIQGWVALGI